MSQIYKSSATGPSPPGDVQILEVDDQDTLPTSIFQNNPQDISAVNNVIILNGNNGIVTYQVPNVVDGVDPVPNIAQIGYIRKTVTTNGAVSDTLTISTDTNSCFTITAVIVGYATDNLMVSPDVGVGGTSTATAINVAGTLTLIDEPDTIFQNPDLPTSNFTITTSGTNMVLQVTGVANWTIKWQLIINCVAEAAKA